MAEENSEQFSVKLCNVLDVMGHSYTQIKNSQMMADQMENLLNQEGGDDYSVFIAGSKKEGLSFLELNSDMDLMFIFKKVKCFQRSDSALRSEMNGVSYILDFRDCPPGYSKIEVDEFSKDNNATLQVYSARPNKTYFSSEMLSNVMSTLTKHGINEGYEKIQGGPTRSRPTLSQLKDYTDTISMLRAEAAAKNNEVKIMSGGLENGVKNSTGDNRENQSKANTIKVNVTVEPRDKNDDVAVIYNREDQTNTLKKPQRENLDKDGSKGLCNGGEAQTTVVTKDEVSNQSIIKSISPTGPSQQTEYKQPLGTFLSQDNVVALPALCTSYIREWTTRKRSYCFPSKERIERISKMDAHAVPVGCKMALDADLQWRICFTLGEVELIRSLNGTQFKLYVLLKLLAKTVIQKTGLKVITSYVIKNVVLWMAELKPRAHFREENIERCLVEAVHFLKMCVKNGFLPNYMIQTRNLLHGKLSLDVNVIVSEILGNLVKERGSMVMRIEKVRDHLNSPYMSGFFQRTRDFTRCCSDVFQMFWQPEMQWTLTDMESVFTIIIQSIERSIFKQTSMVKMQSMVVLKYIENWITELPEKSKERVQKRSDLRAKCGELKKRISLSFALDMSSDPNYKWLIKFVASLRVDVSSVTNDQLDNLVMSESFLTGLADALLKVADYLGAIDDKKLGGLLSDPTQIAQMMCGAKRVGQNQARTQKQYLDFDLD